MKFERQGCKVKKILNVILAICIFMSINAQSITAKDDIGVILDNRTLFFDVPPQIINDRTMVPLRAIFEALDATVNWNQRTKTVTSAKGNTTISLTIDSNIMYVNDIQVVLDSPACIVNDRTLVPVRAISEAYDTDVDWDASSRTVVITSRDTQPNNDDDYEEDYPTPKPTPKQTPKPTATPKPTPTPDENVYGDINEPEVSVSYNDAAKRIELYIEDMLGNEANDVTYEGSKTLVSHNGRKAYKFKLYSKSMQKDNEEGLLDTVYVYEDNGYIEN